MLVPICAYVVMAVSLNLTVGILGELSLGHAGFMSVGAFSGVVAAISLEDVYKRQGCAFAQRSRFLRSGRGCSAVPAGVFGWDWRTRCAGWPTRASCVVSHG